jgi:phenylacetate-CoA ligase
MHIHEDFALAECLDPMGDDPVADGQIGELVVTALTDRAMPLVRFRTDDLVWVDRTPCSCGVTHARFRPIGRKGDQIIVDGKAILPGDVMKVIEQVNESRAGLFQIIRPGREMDKLRVRVGYSEALMTGSPASLAARVAGMLTDAIGVPAEVEVTVNEELLKLGPPHKIPRVTKA